MQSLSPEQEQRLIQEQKQMQDRYDAEIAAQSEDPRYSAQTSPFAFDPQENMIKWQLELDNILERTEHILKNHIIKFTRDGHTIWEPNPDASGRILNDHGVQEVMKVLSMYLNRNTILSDYSEEEIRYKVYDFGKELSDLFFMKYEDFGLTTIELRQHYPMIIRQIVDIIHSAYKRAYHAGERTSLREARSLQQTEQIVPQQLNPATGGMRKERGLLNPGRYIMGKYK